MNTIFKSYAKSLLSLVLLTCAASGAFAQQIRTAYFMETSTARTAMNPAYRPERGYVSIPALGGVNASYTTNGIALDNMLYPRNGKLVTFLDPSVGTNAFLGNLKDRNQVNADFGLQVLSGGWYAGKGFWTVDLSVKGMANVAAPKSLFEFMKVGNGAEGKTYDISDVNLYSEAYLEAGVGYSLPIDEKLTVGAKFKALIGVGSMQADIDHMRAVMGETNWNITASGTMNASMRGLKPSYDTDENANKYISDFEFDSPGVSGFGVGIDLGATYRLTENITLSAAVLDLGFISWGKGSTTNGVMDGTFNFDGFDLAIGDNAANQAPGMADQFEEKKNEFEDLFHFLPADASGHTTRLRSTLNLGGEYRLLDQKLGLGLLSSTRFYSPKAYTELTVSGNYRPVKWFEAALSYSFIHSKFKTYGIALNFSPSWLNFFVGSDYMFTKVTPQFLPVSGTATNLYFGISVPL